MIFIGVLKICMPSNSIIYPYTCSTFILCVFTSFYLHSLFNYVPYYVYVHFKNLCACICMLYILFFQL